MTSRAPFQRYRLRALPLLLTCISAFPASAWATSLSFPDFSDTTGLVLDGSAVNLPDNGAPTYIRIVGDYDGRLLEDQGGSVFSEFPIDSAVFSTQFTFQITGADGIQDGEGNAGADGFAFVIQNISNTAGTTGGGLGYEGVQPSVVVEFDTFLNGENLDPDGNHVGIMVDGVTVHEPGTYATAPVTMEDEAVITVFIVFDGTLMRVWLNDTGAAPTGPALVERDVSAELAAVLGAGSAFVGFTAATGAAFENIDLLTWTYGGVEDACQEPQPTPLACDVVVAAATEDGCDTREDYACSNGTSSTGEEGEEVTYSFTAPEDGDYAVMGAGGPYELYLLEDQGLGLQLGTCLTGASGVDPTLGFTSLAGQTWLIVLDEPVVSGVSHEISVQCPNTDPGPIVDSDTGTLVAQQAYYAGGRASCNTGGGSLSGLAGLLALALVARRRASETSR